MERKDIFIKSNALTMLGMFETDIVTYKLHDDGWMDETYFNIIDGYHTQGDILNFICVVTTSFLKESKV